MCLYLQSSLPKAAMMNAHRIIFVLLGCELSLIEAQVDTEYRHKHLWCWSSGNGTPGCVM